MRTAARSAVLIALLLAVCVTTHGQVKASAGSTASVQMEGLSNSDTETVSSIVNQAILDMPADAWLDPDSVYTRLARMITRRIADHGLDDRVSVRIETSGGPDGETIIVISPAGHSKPKSGRDTPRTKPGADSQGSTASRPVSPAGTAEAPALGPSAVGYPAYWWYGPIANPLRHGLATFDAISSAYSGVTYGIDLASRHIPPAVFQNQWGARAWSLTTRLLYQFVTIYLHEFGHFRVARDYGFEASIHNQILFGFVFFSGPPELFTERAVGDIVVAGLNNQEMFARRLHERRFLGIENHPSAHALYASNQFSATYYLLYSLLTVNIGTADDNVAFITNLTSHGKPAPSLIEMFIVSLATDLLSVDFWLPTFAPLTAGRVRPRGSPLFGPSGISLGPWLIAYPHFSYFRSASEQYVDVHTLVLPPGHTVFGGGLMASRHLDRYRCELSIGHYQDVGNTKWFGVSLGGSIDYSGSSLGYSGFGSLEFLPLPFLGVGADVVFSSGDIYWNDFLGLDDGLSFLIKAEGTIPRIW